MQRLFSIFPTGRPGVALMLMRASLAVMLVDGVSGRLLHLGSAWFLFAPAAIAIALVVGLVTPIACMLTVLLELTTWVTSDQRIGAVHVCAVLDAVGLSMLGPGAYSLDARLFGRRRVIVRGERDRHDR